MKSPIILLLVATTSLFSQSIDYNTQKGYAAEGYDVVAYFDTIAIKGDKHFKTMYDAVQYKFASQEHLNTFLKNPKAYIPQYGGYCAYAIAVDSKKISINPKTFEIRDGKLYLFYNAWGTNTLKLWQKENVKGLQEKADKYWEALKIE
jgi:YHS domain-containing protein